jgi:protein-tyrosine phosphatase
VRADSLPSLTAAGRQALVDYGVSLVVNLRESAFEGLEPLPVPVVRQPIDPQLVPVVWEWPTMREAYLGMADHFRDQFARALTLLGDAEPPAAVHCAGGRDRTGIACGMALWLAGVEPDAIAADHAMSDPHLAESSADWLAKAADEGELDRRRRIIQPPGRTLVEVLEEIERREGIRNLLLGAGADKAALDRLVARLQS